MPPAVRSSVIEKWHGIFNVRNDLRACCTHEKETGGNESSQVSGDRRAKKVQTYSCRVKESNLGQSLEIKAHEGWRIHFFQNYKQTNKQTNKQTHDLSLIHI